MTFEETAAALPNGFHDAELQHFEMDYVHRKLRFDLVVWIGDMDDSRRRELYRPARLTLDDVAFLVIEPPDVNYPWLKAGRIRIEAGEGQPPREFKHPSGRTGRHPDDLDLPRRIEHVSALLRWKRFTRMDWTRSRPTLTRSEPIFRSKC